MIVSLQLSPHHLIPTSRLHILVANKLTFSRLKREKETTEHSRAATIVSPALMTQTLNVSQPFIPTSLHPRTRYNAASLYLFVQHVENENATVESFHHRLEVIVQNEQEE